MAEFIQICIHAHTHVRITSTQLIGPEGYTVYMFYAKDCALDEWVQRTTLVAGPIHPTPLNSIPTHRCGLRLVPLEEDLLCHVEEF